MYSTLLCSITIIFSNGFNNSKTLYIYILYCLLNKIVWSIIFINLFFYRKMTMRKIPESETKVKSQNIVCDVTFSLVRSWILFTIVLPGPYTWNVKWNLNNATLLCCHQKIIYVVNKIRWLNSNLVKKKKSELACVKSRGLHYRLI